MLNLSYKESKKPSISAETKTNSLKLANLWLDQHIWTWDIQINHVFSRFSWTCRILTKKTHFWHITWPVGIYKSYACDPRLIGPIPIRYGPIRYESGGKSTNFGSNLLISYAYFCGDFGAVSPPPILCFEQFYMFSGPAVVLVCRKKCKNVQFANPSLKGLSAT